MNPHGWAPRQHNAEKSRVNQCPWCGREYTQTTFVLQRTEGESVEYWPKLCIPCSRRTLKTSGPLRD